MALVRAIHLRLCDADGAHYWKYTGERMYQPVGVSAGLLVFESGMQLRKVACGEGFMYVNEADDKDIWCEVLDRSFDDVKKLSLKDDKVIGYTNNLSPERLLVSLNPQLGRLGG